MVKGKGKEVVQKSDSRSVIVFKSTKMVHGDLARYTTARTATETTRSDIMTDQRRVMLIQLLVLKYFVLKRRHVRFSRVRLRLYPPPE